MEASTLILCLVTAVAITLGGYFARRARAVADHDRGIAGEDHPISRARQRGLAKAYVDTLVIIAMTWLVVLLDFMSPALAIFIALVLAVIVGYLRLGLSGSQSAVSASAPNRTP